MSGSEGGCACGAVRYRITAVPFAVHCCHCTDCQRETGSAFVLNGLLEARYLEITKGEPVLIDTPSNSGKGQKIARCPQCQVAMWSHYAGFGDKGAFIRMGTLDDKQFCPPDLHIFTKSKQDWVVLGDDMPVREVYYSQKDYDEIFGPDRAARYRAMRGI